MLEVIDIGKGKIMASRGHVLFSVKYKALMFRPMLNEVLNCIVTTIHQVRRAAYLTMQHGIFAEVGPVRLFIGPGVRFAWSVLSF